MRMRRAATCWFPPRPAPARPSPSASPWRRRCMGAEERLPPAGKPMALIIAPTRELAMQVQRELSWLYAETGARVVTCVGGMDGRAEARELSFGAHIVVGTPGRLRDHLERQRLDLSELKTIVLDEADEMLDLGFREDLEFILDATPEGRQTLAVLRHHAARDRDAGAPLSARRRSHRDGGPQRAARRHRLSRHPRGAGRYRKRRRQRAAASTRRARRSCSARRAKP